MRILVIGGTDFIGPAVVRQLVGMGHKVVVFHRGETERGGLPEIAHLHGDRARLAEYAGDVRQFAPDVVLDLFPLTSTVMPHTRAVTWVAC